MVLQTMYNVLSQTMKSGQGVERIEAYKLLDA